MTAEHEPKATETTSATEHAEAPHREGKEAPPRGAFVMGILRWLFVLAMAMLAAWSVSQAWHAGAHVESANAKRYTCPMHPAVHADHPGTCPICGMDLVESGSESATKPEVATSHAGHRHEASDPFLCPMHPEETGRSADDRCPLCHMKLVPRASLGDAGAPAESGSMASVPGLEPIELSAQRVQLIGMRTTTVRKTMDDGSLRVLGTIAARETATSKVTARFSGYIEALAVNETGSRVRAGQLLAEVYSPQVYLAEQELVTALRWHRSAPIASVEPLQPQPGASTEDRLEDHTLSHGATSNLVADLRRRLELLGVGAAELREVERSGTPRRTVAVTSKFSGVVVQKNATVGGYFTAGTDLFVLADLTKVWLLADIYEQDLGALRLGQDAQLQLPSMPGRTFAGKVQFIYPSVEQGTRTGKVRIELDNADLLLKPGMSGDVALRIPSRTGFSIPREAIVDTGAMQYVFLDRGSGRFEPRRVRIGSRGAQDVQVLEGLAEGDVVVTTGNFLLDSESRLRASVQP